MIGTILLLSVFLISISLAQISEKPKKYWVYFKDKEDFLSKSSAWQEAARNLSTRTIERREKNLHTPYVIEAEDLPLYQPYLDEIVRVGGKLHQQSRWFNAASFFLTKEEKSSVERLPFVARVTPVTRFYRRGESVESAPSFSLPKTSALDYGPSFAQADMIGATKVHAMGITGDSVIVGLLDTGFRWRVHESLQGAQVIAERDFIQNDDITANQTGDAAGQDAHGTLTMSVLGGYRAGQLIGPAFGVQFLLGKTEYVPTETQIEEDNWVAGIEWMEGRGVDVVSSSLGYSTFDDGSGYFWDSSDFNGRTAVTSRAAVRAARLGVVVCTAMGNEGNGDGVRGTLIAPADADSILSVGAVRFARTLASFSSTGPTNDGRTKPEVVAPGAQVYGAVPGQSSYTFASGTSLSTPLTAASAALVLSARPELMAMQVRNALLNTADTIHSSRFPIRPNNFIGYGLVNAFQAVLSFGPVFSNSPTLSLVDSQNVVSAIIASKFGINRDSVLLKYTVGDRSLEQSIGMTLDSVMFFPTSGRYRVIVPRQPFGTLIQFSVEARDSSGNIYTSPPPIMASRRWEFLYGKGTLLQPPTSFTLYQNYPNPFNAGTQIRFDSPTVQEGTLTIYNILGQKIRTLYNGTFQPGPNLFSWNGTNENGNVVGSGVYFYIVRTSRYMEVKKMLLLR